MCFCVWEWNYYIFHFANCSTSIRKSMVLMCMTAKSLVLRWFPSSGIQDVTEPLQNKVFWRACLPKPCYCNRFSARCHKTCNCLEVHVCQKVIIVMVSMQDAWQPLPHTWFWSACLPKPYNCNVFHAGFHKNHTKANVFESHAFQNLIYVSFLEHVVSKKLETQMVLGCVFPKALNMKWLSMVCVLPSAGIFVYSIFPRGET